MEIIPAAAVTMMRKESTSNMIFFRRDNFILASFTLESIADAFDGLYLVHLFRAKLFSDFANMDVNRAIDDDDIFIPQLIEQNTASDDPAGPIAEKKQDPLTCRDMRLSCGLKE